MLNAVDPLLQTPRAGDIAQSVQAPAPETPTAAAPVLPTTGSDDDRTLAIAATVAVAGVGLALVRHRTRS